MGKLEARVLMLDVMPLWLGEAGLCRMDKFFSSFSRRVWLVGLCSGLVLLIGACNGLVWGDRKCWFSARKLYENSTPLPDS